MKLYTADDRESVKTFITGLFTQAPDIIALTLIGSAALNYIDELSDIDMMSVVSGEENIAATMDFISRGIREKYDTLCFVQLDKRNLQVYLLSNYLELNISYYTPETLKAKNDAYIILFDKSDGVKRIMESTYDLYSAGQPAKSASLYEEKLAEYSEQTWHFLFHAAIAIKRNQLWRAVCEMNYARNYIIDLKGLRHLGGIGNRQKDVDSIPANELTLLQRTLPYDLSKQALLDKLIRLTDAAYDEFEVVPNNKHITVTRSHVKDYLKGVFPSAF